MVCGGFVAVFLIVSLVSFASASVSLIGTWKGTAKFATTSSCGSAPVVLTLTQCSGTNLVKGVLKVGTTFSVKVLGRIEADNSVMVTGSSASASGYSTGSVLGVYVAGSPAKIKVIALVAETSASPTPKEFDVFYLTKQ
jgi:hypothetical protein